MPPFARFLAMASLAAFLPLAAGAQTLDLATDQSPAGLDPHIATAFSTALVDSLIYEGLTAIDSHLKVVPALAQSWTVSADGRTYTFRLRSGAMFQNGRAVTPADVIASIARVRNPKTASPYASRFTGITAMKAVGKDSVRIVLSAPSAAFLAQLAALAIVPPEAVKTLGRVPVGTGPFEFKQWVPDTDILLARNPQYWQKGLPHLAAIRIDIVPEAATRSAGLQGGTYQVLPVVDPVQAEILRGKPGIRLLQTQDLAYSLIGLNTAKKPFNDPRVRQALNYALDRAQIVQAVYFGHAVPGGPLSPALKAWALPTSAFPCYTHNPARAKALLKAAGYSKPLAVTLKVLGSVKQVVDIAQVAQAELNQAGFAVKLDVQELGKFVADWRKSNFQGFVSLNGGGIDPDDYLGRTYQTGGATNVFKYSNPKLDTLLNAARAEGDFARRKAMYDQAQRMLACDGPIATIAYGTLFAAERTGVSGFAPLPTRSLATLREATLGK